MAGADHHDRRTVPLFDKYRGCLFGLAVGDALGAPVEFLSWAQIKRRYGPDGITDLQPWNGFAAGTVTDDTQMSLATASGCLHAYERGRTKGIVHWPSMVHEAYLAWLKTQDDPQQRRAPGNTCLSALRSGQWGTIENPINHSKGCGGVMRTAPVGLVFAPGLAFQRGAEFAALTHGHPAGYLTAGFQAELIANLVAGCSLAAALDRSCARLVTYGHHEETLSALEQARRLAGQSQPAVEAIPMLGEGWVGEEALAIAVYCGLKFPNDWTAATLAAANHSGDTDSTASIAGAILGTALGIQAIPARWVRQVENGETIQAMAQKLFETF